MFTLFRTPSTLQQLSNFWICNKRMTKGKDGAMGVNLTLFYCSKNSGRKSFFAAFPNFFIARLCIHPSNTEYFCSLSSQFLD